MAFFNQQPPSYDDAPTTLTPYLQLPHLLSLTWLAYPIISLILVAFRLSASLDSSQNAIASAKDNLLASCKAAEEAATSAASMPRYMAVATNEQFADAVNASLRGARQALVLSLTAMEAIINFIIDLYRSIFLCFLELVVRGGLAIMIGAVDELNKVVQTVAGGLRDSLQSSISGAIDTLRSAIEAINRVNPFGDIPVPDIPVPSLDALNDIKIPSSFQESLENLNSTIPTVSDIKGKLEEIINTPFELLKKDINDTFAGIEFQSSILPVPQQNRLAFCDKMDTSVVDDIGRDIVKAFKIGVLVLILLALLLIGLNCLLTWYKWRCMKNHMEYTREAWTTDPTMAHGKGMTMNNAPQVTLSDHNLMILNANSAHPLVTRITNQLSQKLRLKPRNHTKLQWFFNYIFHPPAAACLLIGLFGLLLIEVQLLAVGPLVDKYKGQAADTARDFSLLIADSINQSMLNQSAEYAREVNLKVDSVQDTLNNGVFGWVNVTTTQINSTINEFYTDLENGVNKVFGNTILATPATEFVRCLIGSKVDAIENALTFLHDNLRVDMPRVNETVLILSPESVNEASAPIAAAAIGGGGNGEEDDGGLVGRLVNGYANQLKKERITFAIFLGLWGLVVLMGLGVILWHSFGLPALERRRRERYLQEQRNALPDAFDVPPRDGAMTPQGDRLNLTKDGGSNGGKKWEGGIAVTNDLPQFTPLPSPRRNTFKPFWRSDPATQGVEDGIDHEANSNDSLATSGDGVAKLKTRIKSLKNLSKSKGDTEAQREEGGQNGGWLGRVRKSIFGGKKEEDYDFWERYKDRPQLRIVVDTPSDRSFAGPESPKEEPQKSRWSASPTEPKVQTGWKNLMSPTTKKSAPAAPPSVSAPRRLAPLPPGLRHKPSVPSDIGTSLDDPFLGGVSPRASNHNRNFSDPFNRPASIIPSAYPVPLHSAYEGARADSPSARSSPSRSSPSRHKRISSVPVWRVTNGTPADQSSLSSTDSRQLQHPAGLGGTADDSNPFVTPFDDEHRVQVVKPGVNRKSLKANPFAGTAF